MFESLNPAIIGYTLNVVGLFFLAAAISFKKPRREIEEILGIERQRSLSGVRDHLVNQIQVYVGFVFLVAGYVLLMGHALTQTSPATGESTGVPLIATVLFAATVATMAILKLVQLLFTRLKFKRLLAEVLRDAEYSLEHNQKLAVQIGELLQIPQSREESVPDYILKVKSELGLEDLPAHSPRRTDRRGLPRNPAPRPRA